MNNKGMAEAKKATTHSLSDLNTLFSSSWELFKKVVLSLFVFNLLGVVGYIVLVIVFFGIGFLSAGGAIMSGKIFATGNVALWIILAVLAILFIIGLIIVGSTVEIGSVFIVSEGKKKGSYKQLITAALPLILPLILTGIVKAFFSFGSYFVLVIPGIVLGFMLTFVNFEVILQKRKYLAAVKRSVAIFERNFWPMLGRILLITVIGMILSYIPSLFSHSGRDGFTGFLSSIIGFVFGWYELCYIYTLYKEAEADTPANYKPRMLWIYIVTIVGWIIAIGALIFFVSFVKSPQFQNYMKHAPKNTPHSSSGYTLTK
jgi:hypothetical protein